MPAKYRPHRQLVSIRFCLMLCCHFHLQAVLETCCPCFSSISRLDVLWSLCSSVACLFGSHVATSSLPVSKPFPFSTLSLVQYGLPVLKGYKIPNLISHQILTTKKYVRKSLRTYCRRYQIHKYVFSPTRQSTHNANAPDVYCIKICLTQ